MDTDSLFTICLTDIPLNTPAIEPIYICGNFNDWQTDDGNYKMKLDEQGIYHVEIKKIASVAIEFKFTRGSWDTVECDWDGKDLPNHILSISEESVCFFTKVLAWKDIVDTNDKINPGVSIFEHNYFIPQLNRHRRIWMYLPPDYRENISGYYPVLYMQDGQNLFQWGVSSTNGKWNIDHTLNRLYTRGMKGLIVIGIDNGGKDRINEYSPWVNPKQGGGEGKSYLAFITDTLKPAIDSNFRTSPDRDNTAIMGSSMGGLVSLYAVLARQDVFSKAGIFSPSLWFSDEIYSFAAQTSRQQDIKIALLGGDMESDTMMNDLLALYNTLKDSGYGENELHFDFYKDGIHHESFWEREFGHAILWLFGNEDVQVDDEDMLLIKLLKNGENKLYFSNPYSCSAKICLVNSYGKVVWQHETSAAKQNFVLPALFNGNMIAKVELKNGKYLFRKITL